MGNSARLSEGKKEVGRKSMSGPKIQEDAPREGREKVRRAGMNWVEVCRLQ